MIFNWSLTDINGLNETTMFIKIFTELCVASVCLFLFCFVFLFYHGLLERHYAYQNYLKQWLTEKHDQRTPK